MYTVQAPIVLVLFAVPDEYVDKLDQVYNLVWFLSILLFVEPYFLFDEYAANSSINWYSTKKSARVGFESSVYKRGVFNSMVISQDPRYLVSK